MALPSSPPLSPEADLPSSPPLLHVDSSDHLQRKRHLPDYDSLSSDPIFSDDTSSTGAEDQTLYPRPKRKRIVRGPWWTLGDKRSRKPFMDSVLLPQQRSNQKGGYRNVDSGVWMGSDSSDDNTVGVLSFQNRLREPEVIAHLPVADSASRDAQSVAAEIVNGCVEACKESVDLSDMGLAFLSSETIRPLQQMIRISHMNLWRPREEEYSPLTPSIQLFLASNRLRSLPAELFRLENLTVLSLRGNELTTLPPAIGQLTKLKELNVAGNGIRYLPWELLELLRTRGDRNQIIVRPNPLIQPTAISGPSTLPRLRPSSKSEFDNLSRYGDTRDYIEERRQKHQQDGTLDFRGELELRLKLGRMLRTQYLQEASRAGKVVVMSSKELVFLASSDVRFFTINGTLCRNDTTGPTEDADQIFTARLEPSTDPPTPEPSRVPSLFESATKSAQEQYRLHNINEDMFGWLPETVGATLRKAAKGIEHGNKVCSICHRKFIIVRAEWMEFWFNGVGAQNELTRESVLPFLRKACSWACVRPTEVGEFTC